MRETSDLYKRLIADPSHFFEVSVVLGDIGRLITRQAERILFGGYAILVDRGGAESGFRAQSLISVETNQSVFQKSSPSLGNAIAGEITVTMLEPAANIPRMAQIAPYVRVCTADEHSEWLQMGLYYIDTRETTHSDGANVLKLHGYDKMLMAEQDYPLGVDHDFPCTDLQAIHDIASAIDAEIDPRTLDVMDAEFMIEIPTGYNCRDTLCYIAALYGGNFIFNNDGMLQLIRLGDIPSDTRYLIDNIGYAITFGGDRILV